MNTNPWAELSVSDFFSTYNWTGKTIQLDSLQGSENLVDSSSFLCLSVEEFLQNLNWTGQRNFQTFHQSTPRSSSNLMTLSVAEFFEEMRWESQPEIAPMPKRSTSSSADLSSFQELDLSNLSDLF